jgi:hypothetical protein
LSFGFLWLLALLFPMQLLTARPVSFNLSTNRSFAPTEKPAIHLYAQNVDELEFRLFETPVPLQHELWPPYLRRVIRRE